MDWIMRLFGGTEWNFLIHNTKLSINNDVTMEKIEKSKITYFFELKHLDSKMQKRFLRIELTINSYPSGVKINLLIHSPPN